MSENKQLPALRNEAGKGLQITTIDDLKNVAGLFLQSGIFEDLTGGPEKAMAQAAVKVLAGQELGITPFAAMKGIHLIKGKPTPSYQMVGAIIKRSPRHNYKVLRSDDECAEIEFFCDGVSQGKSKFDTADMQRANLGGDNWRKYPRQMRFARAMTMGANLYIPEVFAGSIYTPDEFGVDVDDEGNPVGNVEVQQSEPKKQTSRKSQKTDSAPASGAANPPQTKAATATDVSAKSTEQQPTAGQDEIADAEEVQEESMDDLKKQPPGQEVLSQMLQTALSNGWTEEQAETYLGEQLEKANIDGNQEVAAITAAMGWSMVTEITNHFLSNKP